MTNEDTVRHVKSIAWLRSVDPGKRRPNGTKANGLRLVANASKTAPAIDDSFGEHVSNTLVFTVLATPRLAPLAGALLCGRSSDGPMSVFSLAPPHEGRVRQRKA
jgi:hypothetical protein